jgi:hypothetical protein
MVRSPHKWQSSGCGEGCNPSAPVKFNLCTMLLFALTACSGQSSRDAQSKDVAEVSLCVKMVGRWESGRDIFQIENDGAIYTIRSVPPGSVLWTGRCSDGIIETDFVGNISYLSSSDHIVILGGELARK